MKEKIERKPDGGLADWIDTLEGMGGDAELLCLLIELRRHRMAQAERMGTGTVTHFDFTGKIGDVATQPPCCAATEEEKRLLAQGDYCPEELWGVGGRPSCHKCAGKDHSLAHMVGDVPVHPEVPLFDVYYNDCCVATAVTGVEAQHLITQKPVKAVCQTYETGTMKPVNLL